MTRRLMTIAVVLAVAALPHLAVADAAKVRFEVTVVEVSNQGTNVDPKAAHMRDAFKKKGFGFTSYKVVAEPSATIPLNTQHQFGLPNGKTVVLTPKAIEKDGKISVLAQIQGLMEMTYSATSGGTNYIDAGKSGGGELYLILKQTRQ